MSRAADFERIMLGESLTEPDVISRVDSLWHAIINEAAELPFTPKTQIEKYLAFLIDNTVSIPQPVTRLDSILYAICTGGELEDFTPLSENETLLLRLLEARQNLFDINGYLNYVCDGTMNTTTSGVPSVSGDVITVTVNAYMDYCRGQKIDVVSGGVYSLSFDVLSIGSGLSFCFGVALDGVSENDFVNAFNIQTGHYTTSFTVPAGYDEIVLGFAVLNGTNAQIKNVKLTKVQ